MCLKYTAHKPNIYTIWYIKCNNIFDKIEMKYPWKYFHLYCLPGGHINWNKVQTDVT